MPAKIGLKNAGRHAEDHPGTTGSLCRRRISMQGGRRTVTTSRSAITTPAPHAPEYQAPTIVVLGSVAQLTLGAVGSFLDGNGRGSKKGKGKKK
jgi:hypothetical protein